MAWRKGQHSLFPERHPVVKSYLTPNAPTGGACPVVSCCD
jgi:hypothetical protein